MPEHIQYQDDDLFNAETQHEHSDVPVRPLFIFIVVFIVFAIVSHVLLYFLYKAFVSAERGRMEAPQTAVSRPASADVPQNQPLLQPFPHRDPAPFRQTPVTDLAEMRKAEDEKLHTYSWVDRSQGTVRIPIEEAKELFVARAALASQTAPANTAPPQAAPAGSQPSAAGKPIAPDTGAVPPPAQTTGGAHP
jgi:hypothetical protein